MIPYAPPDTLYVLGTALLDRVIEALAAYQIARPRTVYVAAGTAELVAWDDCCEDAPDPLDPLATPPMGQLTVNLVRLFRTSTFPQEDASLRGNCDTTMLAATFTVELVRCSTVVDEDDDGTPPSAQTLDDEGRRMLTDALALTHGLVCQTTDWTDTNRSAVFAGLTPIGPAGTCVGHNAVVHVAVMPSCLDCSPPAP